MSSFEIEIKQDFLVEALMNLEEVQRLFEGVSASSNFKAGVEKMFYVAHNLKGGSLSVGFGEIAEFTNLLETLIIKIKTSKVELSADIVNVLLRSNSRLIEMIKQLQTNFAAKFDNNDYMSDLQSCYVSISSRAS